MAFVEFAADEVVLRAGSEFYDAQETARRYILELDTDRLLAPYRREAGLKPLVRDGHVVESYPNWESTGLDGHILGHYLSGVAGFWALEHDDAFLMKTRYVLSVLEECQEAKGTGFVGGMPHSARLFDELKRGDIRAQAFDLNGSWVPLYNLHKLFAGLLDSWTVYGSSTGSEGQHISDTARGIVLRLAKWWCGISDHINDAGFQTMLTSEFGGMNESFAQLYSLTGEERFLAEARRFTDAAFFDPLTNGEDDLTGRHANTQIPKVLGYERLDDISPDDRYATAVQTFWDSVTKRRSVSIGAHSVAEHFNSPDDFSSMIESRQGVETCNSYNMTKLAERLYLRSEDSQYLDFYERNIENHLVSTVGPHEHGFVYFTPMRPGHYRVYSSSQESFWCCVGTGLESHSRYGRLIYTQKRKAEVPNLRVNLFIPSRLTWRSEGIEVTQGYRVVNDVTNELTLDITSQKPGTRSLDLVVRNSRWVEDSEVTLQNCGVQEGEPLIDEEHGEIRLRVTWQGTCRVEVKQRVAISIEPLPDHSPWVSIVRGAKVLALPRGAKEQRGLTADDSRSGHIASGPVEPMASSPIVNLSAAEMFPQRGLTDGSLAVSVLHASGQGVIQMVPFSRVEAQRYSIYLPAARADGAEEVVQMLRAIDTREAAAENRVCDEVKCGQQQSEVDHRYHGTLDSAGREGSFQYRTAGEGGSFSYELQDWERVGEYIDVRFVDNHDESDYDLDVEGVAVGPRSRKVEGEFVVDQYAISRGSLGQGAEPGSRVTVVSVGAQTPKITSIALMKTTA